MDIIHCSLRETECGSLSSGPEGAKTRESSGEEIRGRIRRIVLSVLNLESAGQNCSDFMGQPT